MIELLEQLKSSGAQIRLDGEQLRIVAPRGALTPELKALLSTHKQALQALLRSKTLDQELPPFVPRPDLRHEPFDLTDVQHAYWMGRNEYVELGGFSTHFYIELERAGLDIDRLEASLQRVIARHDMLRAVFDENGRQRVLAEVPPYRIQLTDVSSCDDRDREARIVALRQRMSHNRLTPQEWPLFEIQGMRCPGERLRLFISLDMLIIDASSMFMFFEEWQRCYEDPGWNPPTLRITYRDYAEFERMLQDQQVFHNAKDYWAQRLDDLPPPPDLPLTVSPRSLRSVRFKRRIAALPADEWQRLKNRAKEFGSTPSVLLMTAFSETLRTWSKAPDFTLNVTLFNRHPVHQDVGALLGDFTTTNLLAVYAKQGESFADRMQRLQRQLAQDLEHRHYSGMRVLRDRARRFGHAPGAAMPVVFTSTLALASQDQSVGGFAFFGDYEFGVSQTPQVWLDHQMMEWKGELLLFWDAIDELFPAGMLDDMLDAYSALLRRLATEDALWTAHDPLPLLPAWQHRLFEETNATANRDLERTTLHAGPARQAVLTPEALAVISESGSLTFDELHRQASRLGRFIRRHAAAGAVVGVCIEKSCAQIAAIYGVLHGHGAYLPIDPQLPFERRQKLVNLAQVDLLVTTPLLREQLQWPPQLRQVTLDDPEVMGQDDSPLPIDTRPDELAYVLFTSGSTGEPKGVMIEHRNAANTLQDINRRFGVTPKDRVLGLSAAHFDLSVYDVFGVLAAGGALVLPSPSAANDPAHWTDLVRQHGVTLWNSVPQLLQLWTEHLAAQQQACPTVRQVILSGDWIPVRLPEQVRRCCPSALILASGGPTETAIWCTQFPVGEVPEEWKSIPYGKPLANQRMHIYNDLLEPRAVWVPGEICISGEGVGRGYLNDEERTARQFVVHPQTRERLYKSGDFGRYLPDGNIEFLGRDDAQVKLNGHRIELGEIEVAIRRQPGIVEALVTTAVHPGSGQKQLTAYVVLDGTFDAKHMHRALAAVLPVYMLPAHYVALEKLPLNANGKVDRKALPEPWALEGDADGTLAAPRTDVERRLHAVWRELLDHGNFGVDDNFFGLGLDSISMVRMVAQLNAEFGLHGVSQADMLRQLFAGPTIAELAVAITAWTAGDLQHDRTIASPEAASLTLAGEGLDLPFPATDLQLGYLTGENAGMEFPVRANYYVEFCLAVGDDPQRLEAAMNRVLQRHQDSLVVFRPDGQLEVTRVPSPIRFHAVHDLRGLAPAARERQLREIRAGRERRELPLSQWPWIEFGVCYLDGETRLLINTLNHFVDGVTFSRLLDETQRHYTDPELQLPPLTLTYRDCVLAYKQLEKTPIGQAARHYWQARIPKLPPPPAVPRLAAIDPGTRSKLVRREATIPTACWAAFQRTASQRGISASVAMYGVYAEVLAAWSGSRHFLLASMTSFRHHIPHPEAQAVVGGFAAVYPMEIDFREPMPFHERLRQLQVQHLNDAQHQQAGSGWIWQGLNQHRKSAGRAPAPFVVVSGLDLPAWEQPFHGCLETPQVLFDHQFWHLADGRLWLVLDVNEQFFPAGLVDAFWQAYQGLITRLGECESAWDETGFDLLPESQRALREEANRTVVPRSAGLLHATLHRSADALPDQLAVISHAEFLTYRQLDERANRLAHRLLAAGAKRAEPVLIALERGADQVAAVFGVLSAGAAYVPVDTTWPADRVAFVLADTGARRVVTSRTLRDRLALPAHIECVCMDDPALARYPTDRLMAVQAPDDLAYVIYTSGSTGQPKGVMINHQGALNTVLDVNSRFGISHRDVVFGISSLTFDLSVYDIFGAAAAGAALVLPAPDASPQPLEWVKAVQAHGVTVWNSVPALSQLFIDAARVGGQHLPTLSTVMLSGDWIPVGLPAQIRSVAPRAAVHSLGGATEASIWSIHYPIGTVDEGWASIPYGKPMENQSWHVLTDSGADAPEWVPGDLYIGGIGLAIGYWQDEAKTRKAFVSHPRTGERLYRTGDLGRYLPDGNLEFLGRADHQVKIQGYRVELGEIEYALQSHPAVQSAAVVSHGQAGGKRLAAFVTAAQQCGIDPDALKAHLHTKLPDYMVPQHIVCLPELPLSANGKVDRAALVESAGRAAAIPQGSSPRNAIEAELIAIWESVLGMSPVGVHDDFFDLGGQSFAAIQVMTRIAQQYGQPLPLGELLRGRTVAHLAERLAERAAGTDDWSPLVPMQTSGAGTPLVLVHPAGGNVLCYRELAARLKRPVYGLQAPGLQGDRPPIDDLGELASLYVRALREVQPTGPYQLGGWSSGGIVAFEMCRQIEAMGDVVERLILIDSPAPSVAPEVDEATLLGWFLQDLRPEADTSAFQALPPAERSLPVAIDLLNRASAEVHRLSLDQMEPVWHVFRATLKATRTPLSSPVRAPIFVVKAADMAVDEFNAHPARYHEDWGWSPYTAGSVRFVSFPADHYSMWSTRNIDQLSAMLNEEFGDQS